jgi:PST family polysaccharide transporter
MPPVLAALFRLRQHTGFRRILSNSGWMMAEQLVRLGTGLVLGILTARHLGPTGFGLLSYALAYTSIFSVVAALGLNRILVRELVSAAGNPFAVSALLGSAFTLRLTAAGTLYLLAVFIAWWQGDTPLLLMALVAGGIVCSPADCVDLYFQSRVQSRHAAMARIGAALASAVARAALLWAEAPILAFGALAFGEAVLIAGSLMLAYRRRGPPLRLSPIHGAQARTLLRESLPEVLAALGNILFMRIAQVLLQHMAGPSAVGTYAAAARIAEFWYFVPTAVVGSSFPSIIALREVDRSRYMQRFALLTTGLLLLAYGIAALATLSAAPLVALLFGPAYAGAAPVLATQAWCGILLVLAQTSGAWLVAERVVMLNLYRNTLGLLVCVAANLALIPRHGALGAAIAALLSFGSAFFLFDFLVPQLRPIAVLKLKALLVVPIVLPYWRREHCTKEED